MGIFDFFKPQEKETLWNELQKNPAFQEQKALFDMMNASCANGCETDEIPNAYGEFGHTETNPIPTNTIFGSHSYLGRLLTTDSTQVVYEREGSLTSPAIEHPIDAYFISHPDGTRLATLYLSPYHKRNSRKPPRGFMLLETNSG